MPAARVAPERSFLVQNSRHPKPSGFLNSKRTACRFSTTVYSSLLHLCPTLLLVKAFLSSQSNARLNAVSVGFENLLRQPCQCHPSRSARTGVKRVSGPRAPLAWVGHRCTCCFAAARRHAVAYRAYQLWGDLVWRQFAGSVPDAGPVEGT